MTQAEKQKAADEATARYHAVHADALKVAAQCEADPSPENRAALNVAAFDTILAFAAMQQAMFDAMWSFNAAEAKA